MRQPPRFFPHILAQACALALGFAAFGATPGFAQQVTLRLHTHVPSVSGSYKSLAWWASQVEKDSGGKLKIELYGSMELGGKAADIYDQVKDGVVDIGWTLPGYKAGLFPVTSVFELPFIGAPAHIVSPALDDFLREWGKTEWSAVRPLVFHSAGTSVIHMKTKPIEKLEDFKGMKLRTPSRISSEALTALGAIPVPIPGLKMTEAIMHGVVDGAVTPWSIARAIRTIDVARYHTETTLHEPTLVLIMNKQSYDRLPADLKKAIDENSGAKMAAAFGARWENDDMAGRELAQKLGHPIIHIAPAELARWRKATQPVYDNWIKEMDSKGLNGRELVADAESLIAKYRAQDEAK